MKKLIYTWEEFEEDIQKIEIPESINAIYAVPRGGLVIGIKLSHLFNIPLFYNLDNALKDFKQEEILIVDDISDSGNTFYNIAMVNNYQTVSLFVKEGTTYIPTFFCRKCKKDIWVQFPWEQQQSKMKRDDTNV